MPPVTPHPSPLAGRLLGAVVTVAALGIAASAAVLGITSAYGDHSEHSAAHSAAAAGPSAQAADGGDDMSDMTGSDADAAGPNAANPNAANPNAANPNAAGANSGSMGMPGMGNGGVELYAVQTGTLGIVATDGSGRLLYGSASDANNPPTSRCTDACAQEWQPVVVPKGKQLDLEGVYPDKVGQISRQDGSSQLTLGGWPVYVNRDDPGDLKQPAPDAHGSWFVMTPQGGKINV